MNRNARRLLVWLGAALILAIGTTWAYAALQVSDDYDAAERVLRRGIELVSRGGQMQDTVVTLLPDSAVHDTVALHRRYGLTFVDTYPYEMSSLWSFFKRPAYVWLVCFDEGPIYEGEVRHRRDGIWTLWLTRTLLTQCQGRNGGA